MKKTCKIEVKSIRRSILGEKEFSADSAEEFWDQVEADGVLPEEFLEPEASDRTEDTLYMEPDLPEPGESVLTTYGIVEKAEDGTVRISYEDSEITGLAGCLTTFCLIPDGSMILLRRGELRTCMIFRRGTRQNCKYGDDATMPTVTFHTHALEFETGEAAGRISLDYSVEIRGTVVERNELELAYRVDKAK